MKDQAIQADVLAWLQATGFVESSKACRDFLEITWATSYSHGITFRVDTGMDYVLSGWGLEPGFVCLGLGSGVVVKR